MEPADLKQNTPDDPQFEAWLRSNAARAPLPDDGFSARVLARLPASSPSPIEPSTSSFRGWITAAGALLGVVVAAGFGARGTSTTEQLAALAPQMKIAFAPFAEASTLLALVVTAVSLAFVYRRELLARLILK